MHQVVKPEEPNEVVANFLELNILERDKTVTKEVERPVGGPEEGFFIVVKPFEIDLAIANEEVVPVLSFQAA